MDAKALYSPKSRDKINVEKSIFKNQYIKIRYLLTPACDNPFNLFNNCNVLSVYKTKDDSNWTPCRDTFKAYPMAIKAVNDISSLLLLHPQSVAHWPCSQSPDPFLFRGAQAIIFRAMQNNMSDTCQIKSYGFLPC